MADGQGTEVLNPEQVAQENAVLRERIAVLSEATLRIGATLDVTKVLEEISRQARELARAHYAAIVTVDDAGQPLDVLMSGLSEELEQRLRVWEAGTLILERLKDERGPVRTNDMQGYVRSLGLADDLIVSNTMLVVPMRHRDILVGGLFLGEKEDYPEFTDKDEEMVALLAAQAAAAVAHARTHRAERRARADLEALIEISPVGVVVFDATSGRIRSYNREAERIVNRLRNPGQSMQSLLQESIVRRADGSETALGRFPLSLALANAATVRTEEIVLAVADGRSTSVLLNATPIRAEDDTLIDSVVVTMQDLEPVAEIDRQRADFLGLVSHELRAPLTAIKGSAAMVVGSADLDPVETREFCRIIEDQADHMRTLISELIDAGRIETGTLSVSSEHTEVRALVERARKAFLAAGGNHPLHIDLPADLPPVMADRQRIGQVLNNLFANAARFSPRASPIRVEASRDAAFVAISVADEGAGASPEQLLHLFRKDAAPRVGGSGLGSGLGLSIAKGLVEAHGGRIRAESAGEGQGTRITFTIPVAEGVALETVSADAAGADSAPAAKGRVLLVDDDPQALRFARRALEDSGYAAFVTGDAEEVARMIRVHEPHLVLLDLLLHDADGIELMARLPELSVLPVIFISAYGRDETIARALDAGAVDYIVKPYSPTELIARIRAALRQHREREPFRVGELSINYDERRVTLAGEPLSLTATEYELLRVLSSNAGRVTTYEALQQHVWGGRTYAEPALVRTFIKKLRRKLNDEPATPVYILNERGVGYRMPRSDA